VRGKMLNPPGHLSAHQVYYKTFLSKISKIWLVTLGPSMWGLCMPNFSPLASMVWEEEEVTDGRTDVKHSWKDPYTKFLNSTLALLGRDNTKKKSSKLKQFILPFFVNGSICLWNHIESPYFFWAFVVKCSWEWPAICLHSLCFIAS